MAKQPNRNKLIHAMAAVMLAALMMFAAQLSVNAAPQHGFGTDQGCTGAVNANDFHTASWERFSFQYRFTSGASHSVTLGRPTTFHGFVPVDAFTVNIRRDANVSLRPPSYGIFSAQLPTTPANPLFAQPVNPSFSIPVEVLTPIAAPRVETVQQSVSSQPVSNTPSSFAPPPSGGFLPPTSIG